MIKKILLLTTLLIIPSIAMAQRIETFQQVPIWGQAGDTASILDAVYTTAIAVAAILVVFRLIWAGVQYTLSEVVTSKENAKETIKSSLLGLLIILGAVTILNTVNPQITNLEVIGQGDRVTLTPHGAIRSNDRIGMRIGDWEWESSLRNHCSGFISTDENCVNQYVNALRASCQGVGGQLVREENRYTSWIGSGSGISYTCRNQGS